MHPLGNQPVDVTSQFTLMNLALRREWNNVRSVDALQLASWWHWKNSQCVNLVRLGANKRLRIIYRISASRSRLRRLKIMIGCDMGNSPVVSMLSADNHSLQPFPRQQNPAVPEKCPVSPEKNTGIRHRQQFRFPMAIVSARLSAHPLSNESQFPLDAGR